MKVFIADDSQVLRERLDEMLSDLPGIEIMGYAQDVPEAITSIKKLNPDVVILDIRRDLCNGDRNLLNWLNHYGKNSLVVLTKADKLSRNQSISRVKLIERHLEKMTTEKPILFSAKTREGRTEIWEKIKKVIEIENLQGHRP